MRKVAMTALAKAYACTVCSLWEEEDAEELVRRGLHLRLACVPGDPPCHASALTLLWLWSCTWLGAAAEC